jgi:hypothetical protein
VCSGGMPVTLPDCYLAEVCPSRAAGEVVQDLARHVGGTPTRSGDSNELSSAGCAAAESGTNEYRLISVTTRPGSSTLIILTAGRMMH